MSGAKGRSGGKREGAGRKPFQPTENDRRSVEQLTACGASVDEIARCMGITVPTVRKHFEAELASGLERVVAQVASSLVGRALDGDNTAAIFFLKARAGWTDRQRVEVSGTGGGPIQNVTMTPDEFRAIARGIADEV